MTFSTTVAALAATAFAAGYSEFCDGASGAETSALEQVVDGGRAGSGVEEPGRLQRFIGTPGREVPCDINNQLSSRRGVDADRAGGAKFADHEIRDISAGAVVQV